MSPTWPHATVEQVSLQVKKICAKCFQKSTDKVTESLVSFVTYSTSAAEQMCVVCFGVFFVVVVVLHTSHQHRSLYSTFNKEKKLILESGVVKYGLCSCALTDNTPINLHLTDRPLCISKSATVHMYIYTHIQMTQSSMLFEHCSSTHTLLVESSRCCAVSNSPSP